MGILDLFGSYAIDKLLAWVWYYWEPFGITKGVVVIVGKAYIDI
jgi:hypothetical protein